MTRVGDLEGSGGRSDLDAKLKASWFREGGGSPMEQNGSLTRLRLKSQRLHGSAKITWKYNNSLKRR